MRDFENEPQYYLYYLQDINEKRQALQNFAESQKLLQTLFDNLNVGIAIVNYDGLFLQVNKFFCNLIEYTENELIGKFCLDIIPDNFLNEGRAALVEAFKGINPKSEYATLKKKKGGIVSVITTVSPHKLEDGSSILIGVINDISSLQQAEKQSKESQRLLKSIFDTITIGISLTDENGIFIQVNNTFCEILGYNAEELTGKHYSIVFDPYNSSESEIEHLLKNQAFSTITEISLIGKKGDYIDVLSSYNKIVTEDGRPIIVSVISDISERKKTEEKLKISNLILQTQQESSPEGILIIDKSEIGRASCRERV